MDALGSDLHDAIGTVSQAFSSKSLQAYLRPRMERLMWAWIRTYSVLVHTL